MRARGSVLISTVIRRFLTRRIVGSICDSLTTTFVTARERTSYPLFETGLPFVEEPGFCFRGVSRLKPQLAQMKEISILSYTNSSGAWSLEKKVHDALFGLNADSIDSAHDILW